jgi:hypothetical protein
VYYANKYVANNTVERTAMDKKLKLGHGNWVVGDQFWDREQEIERFTELIEEGAHILLVAPRRIGKTSLMREAARRINGRYICLQVDLQKSQSPADALVELSAATRPYKKIWERTLEIFRNVMCLVTGAIESLKIDDLTLTFRSGLTSGDWSAKGDRLLSALADSDTPVVVFFDEIAILVNRMLKGSDYTITPERIGEVDSFMSWLRENSIRHKGKLRIVLTGSIGIEHVLRQAGLSATLNTFSPFDLPPWDSKTAIGCLQALANQYDIKFEAGVPERIVELLGCCIPHHVETFFDAIYTNCKLRGHQEVTNDLVQEVYRTRMLGVSGHAELSHLEERLKMVLGPETYPLALELLTEAAVVGRLTMDAAIYLSEQYTFENLASKDALREIFGIFEHDGYLRKTGAEFRFVSHLLRDWWKARFEFYYTLVSERRGQ